jgi:hypothetical protein
MSGLKLEIRPDDRTNAIFGYINGRHFATLTAVPAHNLTKEAYAELWLKNMKRVEVYPNRVEGTGMPGRWALAFDGCFDSTFQKKTSALLYASNWAKHL